MPEYQKVSYTSYTTSKIFSCLQGQLPAPMWMSNCDKSSQKAASLYRKINYSILNGWSNYSPVTQF